MKKLLTIILIGFIFSGCKYGYKKYPIIVDKVELNTDNNWNAYTTYKYMVTLKDEKGDNDMKIFTNELVKVGDTLKIGK